MNQSLARSTAVMTAGTIVSRATGVVRLAVVAGVLGVTESRLPDTYNLANTAPNILYELVLGGVIGAIFVPLFVEVLEKEDRETAARVISGILNWSLLVLAGLAVIGVLAAPLIGHLYSARLSGADAALQRDVITFLLRLFIPQVVLYGLYFVTAAIINAHKRFGPPMFTPIVNNLVLIAVMVVFARVYGSVGLRDATTEQLLVIGLGTTVSVAPMGFLLIPYLRRLGIYRATLAADHPAFRKLARLSVFVVGFVVANQLGYVVIQWLANEQQGGYSAYVSAFTFFLLPVGLFVWSLTTAMVPTLSEHATNERWAEYRAHLSTGLRAAIFLTIPAAVGFIVLARPLIQVLLQHGIVTSSSTHLVADVLVALSLGLVQFSVFQVLVRASYALKDTRTPFLINAATVLVITGLSIPLFELDGVRGIAFAQAIGYTLCVGLQAGLLAKRVGGIEAFRVAGTAARSCAAAAVMGALVFGLSRVIASAVPDGGGEALAIVVICTLAGAGTYLGVARLLGVEEVAHLRRIVRPAPPPEVPA